MTATELVPSKLNMFERDELANRVLDAAIEVHKALGPGLHESAYEACLARELSLRNMNCECRVRLPLSYKGAELNCDYQVDMIVERKLIVEIQASDEVTDQDRARLRTFMRLSQNGSGLLLNFNVPVLREAAVRIVF